MDLYIYKIFLMDCMYPSDETDTGEQFYRYTRPQIIRFTGERKGTGACNLPGSGDVGLCENGPGAGDDCYIGNQANDQCVDGSYSWIL